MSIRTRRTKKKAAATLNLVSLMDIFTILVFFLMVNASEVEILETSSDIKLPDSVAEDKPERRLVISVNASELMVQGRSLITISEIMLSDADIILPLQTFLKEQSAGDEDESGSITILGDRSLPYALLKRIMTTCQQANYTRIALAVNQVTPEVALR